MNTPNTKPTAEFQFERGTWDAKLIASNPNTDPTTAPKLVRVTCLIRADTLQALVAADQAVAAIGGGSALPASTWANGALSHCLEKQCSGRSATSGGWLHTCDGPSAPGRPHDFPSVGCSFAGRLTPQKP